VFAVEVEEAAVRGGDFDRGDSAEIDAFDLEVGAALLLSTDRLEDGQPAEVGPANEGRLPIAGAQARPASIVGRPAGGGHRVLGRADAPHAHRSGLGFDHVEVVVDDHTRLAYVALVPNESASSAARALLDAAVWFAERGVRIERVLTDNAWAYTSPTYERALASIDAGHRRTRPYRPQTNGKAERFIKTLLAEWAYGRLYRTNDERLEALPAWVAYYNDERTHTALGGITPTAALVNNLRGNHN